MILQYLFYNARANTIMWTPDDFLEVTDNRHQRGKRRNTLIENELKLIDSLSKNEMKVETPDKEYNFCPLIKTLEKSKITRKEALILTLHPILSVWNEKDKLISGTTPKSKAFLSLSAPKNTTAITLGHRLAKHFRINQSGQTGSKSKELLTDTLPLKKETICDFANIENNRLAKKKIKTALDILVKTNMLQNWEFTNDRYMITQAIVLAELTQGIGHYLPIRSDKIKTGSQLEKHKFGS